MVYELVYFNGPINGMAAIGHRLETEGDLDRSRTRRRMDILKTVTSPLNGTALMDWSCVRWMGWLELDGSP